MKRTRLISISCAAAEQFTVLVPLADDQISVKVNESGWAWMVCGERLIIWKICQTAVAKVAMLRWLRLPHLKILSDDGAMFTISLQFSFGTRDCFLDIWRINPAL